MLLLRGMATVPTRPRTRRDFKIAIICALPLEAGMVESVFDKFWDDEGETFGKAPGDQNAYTTGVIGKHNVVLAHMPSMRGNSAAAVAAGLHSSFGGIEVALVVGICGVVPKHAKTNEEIVLGDCTISTAVVQYDFGRQYPERFVRKGSIEDSLGRANREIRSLTSMLTTCRNRTQLEKRLGYHLHVLQGKEQNTKYPGVNRDRLFEPSYPHQHRPEVNTCHRCLRDIRTCQKDCNTIGCENDHLIVRERLHDHGGPSSVGADCQPRVYFGRFGSANTVMKSGLDRDRIAREDEVIAFEMEGSGVWDTFPTVVIKSACDYADSHKSKEWQSYAAATAAAGMKAVLEKWEVSDQTTIPS